MKQCCCCCMFYGIFLKTRKSLIEYTRALGFTLASCLWWVKMDVMSKLITKKLMFLFSLPSFTQELSYFTQQNHICYVDLLLSCLK